MNKENFKEAKEIQVAEAKEKISQVGGFKFLENAPEKDRANKEIVSLSVIDDGYALCFASQNLQNDPEIVLQAVKQNGLALQFASKEICANKEIVKTAIKQERNAFKFVSPELHADSEIQEIAFRE